MMVALPASLFRSACADHTGTLNTDEHPHHDKQTTDHLIGDVPEPHATLSHRHAGNAGLARAEDIGQRAGQGLRDHRREANVTQPCRESLSPVTNKAGEGAKSLGRTLKEPVYLRLLVTEIGKCKPQEQNTGSRLAK